MKQLVWKAPEADQSQAAGSGGETGWAAEMEVFQLLRCERVDASDLQ